MNTTTLTSARIAATEAARHVAAAADDARATLRRVAGVDVADDASPEDVRRAVTDVLEPWSDRYVRLRETSTILLMAAGHRLDRAIAAHRIARLELRIQRILADDCDEVAA